MAIVWEKQVFYEEKWYRFLGYQFGLVRGYGIYEDRNGDGSKISLSEEELERMRKEGKTA